MVLTVSNTPLSPYLVSYPFSVKGLVEIIIAGYNPGTCCLAISWNSFFFLATHSLNDSSPKLKSKISFKKSLSLDNCFPKRFFISRKYLPFLFFKSLLYAIILVVLRFSNSSKLLSPRLFGIYSLSSVTLSSAQLLPEPFPKISFKVHQSLFQ